MKNQEVESKEFDKIAKAMDFMFEEDNMNYVTFLEITDKKTGKRVDYSYNQYAYNKALDKFKNSLDEKYGKNLDSSDENYIKKKEELNKWISKNTIKLPNTYEVVPNPKIYPAKKLTDLQKKFYSFRQFLENTYHNQASGESIHIKRYIYRLQELFRFY